MAMVTGSAETVDPPQMADAPIFLIDRDDGVRDSLKVLLESYGFKVQAFAGRAEFLAKATAQPGSCLILSFNRHIVDGLDMLAALRQRRVMTPALFVVGGGNAATRASALAAGAAAYLERPVEEKTLIRAIIDALHDRGHSNSSMSA